MADRQQTQYDATKITKEVKATATVAGWLGEDDPPAVLNLTHTHNEAELIVACPA